MAMMPLRRRMLGPSICVVFSSQGKNFFGSMSPPRSEIDFTPTLMASSHV